ncbi:hypothetical protein DN300_26055, partial [Salmonella enterica subsp. enterica serovar Potsdam]|nr:hypothetical protein [Salmonella enterica subsp. enterica serovar Potsdam]
MRRHTPGDDGQPLAGQQSAGRHVGLTASPEDAGDMSGAPEVPGGLQPLKQKDHGAQADGWPAGRERQQNDPLLRPTRTQQ